MREAGSATLELSDPPHAQYVHRVEIGPGRRHVRAAFHVTRHRHAGRQLPVSPATTREEPMSDFQVIADRVEIEALRGEFTDAVMMNDHDRLASLFTPDGAVRIPLGNIEAAGREQIRALGERRQALADYFLQTTHAGTIQLDGSTATGRAYLSELARLRNGSSQLNYFVYHDRYLRTSDGWKFTERVAEFRYLDTTPLPGSAPGADGNNS